MTPLQVELTTDPTGLGYSSFISIRDDQGIYNLISTKTIVSVGTIAANQFAIWTGETGMRALIEDNAVDKTSSVRNSALLLLDLLQGNLDKTLDLSNTTVVSMMQGWVTAGYLSQANANTLLTLAATKISRADQLSLAVSVYDISNALNSL